MSTIFNTSYAETLQRVQGERREQSPAGTGTEENRFPKLLSDIERGLNTSPAEKHPDDVRASLSYNTAPKAAEGTVSNLSFTETEHFLNTRPDGDTYRLNRQELSIGPKSLTSDALSFTETVSLTPKTLIQPSLPTLGAAGRAPAMPKLLSAKRIDKTAEPTPQNPVVASGNLNEDMLEGIIAGAGKHLGVDPSLSIAVARAESSLRPDAVSQDGHHSKGMFQLLDATGKELMGRMSVDGSYNPFDPTQNAQLGIGYLRRLHDLFSRESDLGSDLKTSPVKSAGDLEKFAVAAFNAGEGNVARAQQRTKQLGQDPGSYEAIKSHLPASTRAYVERVTALKASINGASDDDALA